MRVILTAQAVADLRSIRSYVSQDSPRAADRLGRQLVEACETLTTHPNRGRQGLEPGTREYVAISPYVIAYRVQPDAVYVLHIWHGAQSRPSA